MKNFTRALVAPLTCLALAACGAPSQTAVKADATSANALTSHLFCDTLLLACDEQLGDNANSIQCIALRTKITAEKAKLKLSSVWREVEKTPAWETFEADRKHFHGADCKWDAPEPTEECEVLQDKLKTDWDSIKATAQWAAVENDSTFKDIKGNIEQAKKIDCYAH